MHYISLKTNQLRNAATYKLVFKLEVKQFVKPKQLKKIYAKLW